ncbi:keywimysin-related RiPP [Nocardia fusca]|uniref:keywimysin-related RiPP n=1 Tax=Nocardia fusca TaxID=941183 RepID=UPI0012F4F777|nr:keywimysin-related RiPP [Nocardia fusca]
MSSLPRIDQAVRRAEFSRNDDTAHLYVIRRPTHPDNSWTAARNEHLDFSETAVPQYICPSGKDPGDFPDSIESRERWIKMIRKQKYDTPALIKVGDFLQDTGNLKRGGFEPNIVLPLGA